MARSERTVEAIRHFAANVRRQRLDRGWTQEHLAEKIGVEVVTVQNIEGGRTAPSFGAVIELGTLFGGVDALLESATTPVRNPGRPRRRPKG